MTTTQELIELMDRRWRTELVLSVRGQGASDALPTVQATFHGLVEQVEQVASRFRPDSAITAANRGAGTWVPAPPLLVRLVRVARAAAEATQGLVDPCLGDQVDAAGYRSWAADEVLPLSGFPLPRPVAPAAAGASGSWHQLEATDTQVRVPRGAQLDLGATAKAWLADELAERVAARTGLDVVANMGGDLRAIAVEQPWVLGVDHLTPGPAPVSIELTDAGLATSGQGHRRWLTVDGPRHHLIDPRTGTSAATRWWAVSVLAASATAANTAATAGMLLDGAAPGWLGDRGLDGVLTAWSGAGPVTRQIVGRWPAVAPGASAQVPEGAAPRRAPRRAVVRGAAAGHGPRRPAARRAAAGRVGS